MVIYLTAEQATIKDTSSERVTKKVPMLCGTTVLCLGQLGYLKRCCYNLGNCICRHIKFTLWVRMYVTPCSHRDLEIQLHSGTVHISSNLYTNIYNGFFLTSSILWCDIQCFLSLFSNMAHLKLPYQLIEAWWHIYVSVDQSSLAQVMVYHLFCTMPSPLPEPMLPFLSVGISRTYFSESIIQIQTFSLKKVHLKMQSCIW